MQNQFLEKSPKLLFLFKIAYKANQNARLKSQTT